MRTTAIVVLLLIQCRAWSQPQLAPFPFLDTPGEAQVLATGDLNGDGLIDVAVAGAPSSSGSEDPKITILLQTSDGLQPALELTYPPSFNGCGAMAVSDMDLDGLDDIVVGVGDEVVIFLQGGTHTFDVSTSMPSGGGVDGLAVADLNNDGFPDIATSHMYETFIRLFHGGPGGFTSSTIACPAAGNNELNAADINGDGLMDLLLMPGQFSTSLYVFTQDASGALSPCTTVPPDLPQSALYTGCAIGDLDQDGLNDIVVSTGGNSPQAHLSLWYQDSGSHTLHLVQELPPLDLPGPVELADLDCDGRPEILVMRAGSIACYSPDSDGAYGPYTSFPLPYETFHRPQSLTSGDIDDDGRIDVLVATYQGFSLFRNSTMPDVLDSVVYHVDVDTTYSTIIESLSTFTHTTIDTTDDWVIHTSNIHETRYSIRLDSIRIDSLVLSYGTLCGGSVMEELGIVHLDLLSDTLSGDTLLVYTSVDSVALSIGERSTTNVLRPFPNPTNGAVTLEVLGDSDIRGATYALFDPQGRCIRNARIMALPFRIDLGDLPPATYHLRVMTRIGSWTTMIVRLE